MSFEYCGISSQEPAFDIRKNATAANMLPPKTFVRDGFLRKNIPTPIIAANEAYTKKKFALNKYSACMGEERPIIASPKNKAANGRTQAHNFLAASIPPIKATAPIGLKFGILKTERTTTKANRTTASMIMSVFFI